MTTLDPRTAWIVVDLQRGIASLAAVRQIDVVAQHSGRFYGGNKPGGS